MDVGPDDELVWLRREVARLRGENGRLSRLLELSGSEVTPAAEQLAVSKPQGLVTKASSVEDKLALYMDVFRARADVYAVYRENRREGRHWWMPATTGRWPKGCKGQFARRLPLTRDVLVVCLVNKCLLA